MENLNLEGFLNYLKTQTNLSERSVKLYYWIVRNFLASFEPTIENMNARIKEYPIAKFAFKHFLAYLGRPEEAKKLIKARPKPKKKEGVYLPRDQLFAIIQGIGDEKYRMVALLQLLTGARAHEILKLKKEDFKEEGEWLRIRIVGKGGVERVVFIPSEFKDDVLRFVQSSAFDYPFLRGSSESFARLLHNNYIYYYKALKESAAQLGFKDFSTHDFRRNFINAAYSLTKDIRVVKSIAGHKLMKTTLEYMQQKISEEEFKTYIKEILKK